MKQLVEKFNFELLHAFNFSCTWKKKKLVLVGKILWRFNIILYIWLLYLFFSLGIPVIINILYEMIKILHEKMFNAIYLYWFHNDTLGK